MPQNAPSLTYSTFKVFAVLIFIIAIILFIAYLLRKVNFTGSRVMGKENFDIVSRFPLGERKFLFLVRVGNELILLGVTSQNISFIKNVDKESFFNNEKSHEREETFLKLLKSKLRGKVK